jgi:3-oxoacyl-[acyl-carrier protein] reductase
MITADLTGTRALVTGGASGIGLATAHLFARCGAAVAINDIPGNKNLAEEVAALQAENLPVVAIPGEVGDSRATGEMVESAAKELGGLDYLINNAGAPYKTQIPFDDLESLNDELWERNFRVNLVGAFRCTQAAVPYLKESRGAVVNNASAAGLVRTGVKGNSMAYAATKAALINLTASLARGLGPLVRVNAVAPGLIKTPRNNYGAKWRDPDVGNTCLGRGGTAEDVAEVILFLCAGAGYMTGQTLVVDGGLHSVY